MVERHQVAGTVFTWPDLPGPDEIGAGLYWKLRGQRESILEQARKITDRPPARCASGGRADSPYRQPHTCRDPAKCRMSTLTRRSRERPPTRDEAKLIVDTHRDEG